MVHETSKMNSSVCIMWCEPRISEPQEIKVNSRVEIYVDDMISVGNNENPIYYHVIGLKDTRESTLKGYNYITLIAQRLTGVKAITKMNEVL